MSIDLDEETKTLLSSKTFWVNTLSGLAVAFAYFGIGIPQEVIEPFVIFALPLLNIVLRLYTYKPISGVATK